MEPLTIAITQDCISEILARLKQAMHPVVEFSEDIEQMRKAAQLKTLQHVVAAYDLLKAHSAEHLS